MAMSDTFFSAKILQKVMLKNFAALAKTKDDAFCHQFVIAAPKIHKKWLNISDALNVAITRNHIMTARELIHQGASLDSDVYGQSILEVAVAMGASPMIAMLLEQKCDVNIVSKSGNTALMAAVKYDFEPIVMQLLEAKADVDIGSPLKTSFNKSYAKLYTTRSISPEFETIGLELMRRGADFASILDMRPGVYTGIFETRTGPFAEYIYNVYSEQVFTVLSRFFGTTYCSAIGDMIAQYLSVYAI
ncbi:MAG: hypothetical protein Faunusvirus13_2 [Faunusvirus sp.]|jgi:hypothetical protein|uniref:Uncharacterized protein n=1 Tax=Faunusvirus sp. TaxID=2487766 RepID=A0A3G5A1N2_9VIRU|nr:MAG: hypothetical protein Faunusvirus13_2 [Faunusvirus sp.]